jgi:hypothetical protein
LKGLSRRSTSRKERNGMVKKRGEQTEEEWRGSGYKGIGKRLGK